jgi:hypothetical protein
MRGLLSRSQILEMVCRPHALLSNCADLLLVTWSEHHFMDDIQTRRYCCPEVTLGAKWETSANTWGVACVVSPIPTTVLAY